MLPTIPAILASLDVAREDESPAVGWLETTAAAPDELEALVFAHAEATQGRLKSRRGVAYDLYADTVSRHRSSERVALWSRDTSGRWASLTYRELDERACACAAGWLARAVKPGDKIALVMGFGPDLVVALMATLRIGLVPALVDPAGSLARSRALDALAPAHVVLDPQGPVDVGAWQKKTLPVSTTAGVPPTPAPAYAPKQAAALFLSPLHAPLDKPIALEAGRAFSSALRDAVLTLRLSPGTTIAAPGVDLRQYQPALLWSTLLAGATFVHVPADALAREPRALFERPAQVLLVTAPVRDALLTARPKPAELPTHWLRPVEEPFDWSAWRTFVTGLGLTKTMGGQLLMDASDGGCVLTSARRPGSANMRALPAAGQPWALADVATPQRSGGSSGVFTALTAKKPRWPGWFILAKVGTEYLYGGAVTPRRGGHLYPAQLVADAAAEVPGVRAAAIATVPQEGLRTRFVLCLFSAGPIPDTLSAEAVRAHLTERVGSSALPDAIEIFPLFARAKGPAADAEWVQREYLLGWLQAKSQHRSFQKLTQLRGALAKS